MATFGRDWLDNPDRNMPEDDDIGPFFFENDKVIPDHPQQWTVDRDSEHGMMPDRNQVTGEDVASLLHYIHHHYPERVGGITRLDRARAGRIFYFEDELLPVLEALGLPKPIWKHSMSIETWKKLKKK